MVGHQECLLQFIANDFPLFSYSHVCLIVLHVKFCVARLKVS